MTSLDWPADRPANGVLLNRVGESGGIADPFSKREGNSDRKRDQYIRGFVGSIEQSARLHASTREVTQLFRVFHTVFKKNTRPCKLSQQHDFREHLIEITYKGDSFAAV